MKLVRFFKILIISLISLSFSSCSNTLIDTKDGYKVIETGPFKLKVNTENNEAVIIDGDEFNDEVLNLKSNKYLKKYTLIGIGESAFYECDSIKELILSDNIKFVGRNNFINCNEIIDIELNEGIRLFSAHIPYSFDVSQCYIPSSLIYSSFGYDLFSNIEGNDKECEFDEKNKYIGINKISNGITKIILPEKANRIEFNDDARKYILENVELNTYNNGLYIGSKTNPYMLLIGVSDFTIQDFTTHENTMFINYNVFERCNNLKKVRLTGNIINPHGYFGTDTVENVILDEGIEIIGDNAFSNCLNLKEITIPSTCYYIKDFAFYNCPTLEKVHISNNTHCIGGYTFFNCNNLIELKLPTICTGMSNVVSTLYY